jgi:hypothetical protein
VVLVDLQGLLRRPALLGLVVLRRRDRLYRPAGLEVREALQGRETNRNQLIRAPSPKPKPTVFFA